MFPPLAGTKIQNDWTCPTFVCYLRYLQQVVNLKQLGQDKYQYHPENLLISKILNLKIVIHPCLMYLTTKMKEGQKSPQKETTSMEKMKTLLGLIIFALCFFLGGGAKTVRTKVVANRGQDTPFWMREKRKTQPEFYSKLTPSGLTVSVLKG